MLTRRKISKALTAKDAKENRKEREELQNLSACLSFLRSCLRYNHGLARCLGTMPMKLAQIASALDARLENGSPDTEITGVAGIKDAGPGQLTFVANPKYAGAARTTKASAVIVTEEFPAVPAAMLRSKNPYLAFAHALELFYQAAAV